jgi:hypothetical protein
MATRILLRRGFSADWQTANPILSYGEVGIEIDQKRFRIGDGTTRWNALSYYQDTGSILGGVGEDYNTLKKIADYVDGKILPLGGADGQALVVEIDGESRNVVWSALSFSGLSDVNLTAPPQGNIDRNTIEYDNAASKWINRKTPRIYVQELAPTDAREGDLWIW